eukprot:365060-Chlamydomonas_euryale.AAC.5
MKKGLSAALHSRSPRTCPLPCIRPSPPVHSPFPESGPPSAQPLFPAQGPPLLLNLPFPTSGSPLLPDFPSLPPSGLQIQCKARYAVHVVLLPVDTVRNMPHSLPHALTSPSPCPPTFLPPSSHLPSTPLAD